MKHGELDRLTVKHDCEGGYHFTSLQRTGQWGKSEQHHPMSYTVLYHVPQTTSIDIRANAFLHCLCLPCIWNNKDKTCFYIMQSQSKPITILGLVD